ncbi:MAG: aminoglycoside phosphotransferase family protein [Desulfobulbaceae bacterium]|uniref:Aminoglycoside phosphotransferase family protein n=1 Tax=Candidatus Desulfatifera sulfidica TaxID=2841691 RepID=A0A8J6N782_9BACT|nr:aminoglycoside phosphotransferase family protein [Candidatus Desulfatifera sulfidica]
MILNKTAGPGNARINDDGLDTAIDRYCLQPSQAQITPLGRGLINDTYLIVGKKRSFILQEINTRVFSDPELIIHNMALLSRHISQHAPRQEPHWKHCDLVQTLDGCNFFRDRNGRFWRALRYIEHSACHEQINNRDQAREVGRALGIFHRQTADLDASKLHIALPGFHVLPDYLKKYDALPTPDLNRKHSEIEYCRAVIEAHRPDANFLEQGRDHGDYAIRCIHGDPKAGNVLFEDRTNQAVSLIDLDTVGPGLSIVDLGDCLRSCCSMAGNDRAATTIFSFRRCQGLLRGYFQKAPTVLNTKEQAAIYDALRLITFELGLRFFSDHLSGNSYFKIEQPDDNLNRALMQFQLLASIERQEQELRALLSDLS